MLSLLLLALLTTSDDTALEAKLKKLRAGDALSASSDMVWLSETSVCDRELLAEEFVSGRPFFRQPSPRPSPPKGRGRQ